MILYITQGFTETLEMNHFPFSEEADRIADLRVFDDAEDVIVGAPGFLFCCNLIRTNFLKVPMNFNGDIPRPWNAPVN